VECPVNIFNQEEVFSYTISTLKENIKTWEYFVNWNKVLENLKSIEKELYLLNFLVGKSNPANSLKELLGEYPKVAKTLPFLVALRMNRAKKEKVLVDILNFEYLDLGFSKNSYTEEEIETIVLFFEKTGLADIFRRNIKNVYDYVLGIEVGLDSNGRKNRTGTLMEKVCEVFISKDSQELGFSYIPQATREAIVSKWGIDIKIAETNRRIDFATFFHKKLFFVEVNFYAGGGSKLKATA